MPLTLRIVIHNAPPGVWCALQHGHGASGRPTDLRNTLEPVDQFLLTADVKNDRPSGPFIQKDGKGSFVYLVWGASAGQPATEIAGRTKVYLPPSEAQPRGDRWVVDIPGGGRNGQPAYATVAPLEGWRDDPADTE